jgi:hypothetical protein
MKNIAQLKTEDMKEVILSTFILQRKAIVRTFKKSEGKNVM